MGAKLISAGLWVILLSFTVYLGAAAHGVWQATSGEVREPYLMAAALVFMGFGGLMITVGWLWKYHQENHRK
ncbi:hypothetical protein IC614_08470 [Allosphingosinicella flava]|uniref:Uncharacterized protein n=1 Tax=Allosphingosinicella flava TaxID=2771430 RepID=A0A7T2LLC9_9SPHN|nr:hypothetical protein [Sphingosinicella flava]QPQ54385.1 hypothetical protein IC614_08470 [Sphingosinicella flava]